MRPSLLSVLRTCRSCGILDRNFMKMNRYYCTSFKPGYIVFAPDLPSDTPDNNVMLCVPTGEERAKFPEATPYKTLRAFMKRIMLFESALDELEQGALEGEKALTLDQAVQKIEQHLVPLMYAYSAMSLMYTVDADNTKIGIMNQATELVDKVSSRRFKIMELYQFMKKESEKNEKVRLHRFQKRLIDKYVLEGRMNGLETLPHETEAHRSTIKTKSEDFVKTIETANQNIGKFMARPDIRSSVPPDFFMKRMNNQWSPHDNSIMNRFLSQCNSADVRKKFYDEYTKRASKAVLSTSNNSVNIEDIRRARNSIAELAKYDNYTHMSMQTKMAGYVENIKTMLNTMKLRSEKSFETDLKTLTDFAKISSPDVEKMNLWDIPYYRRQYLESTESASVSQAMQYNYNLESVLKAIFNLSSRLFQVEIVESKNFQAWHPSVRLFDVITPNGFYGSFYLDPCVRENKAVRAFCMSCILLPRSDANRTKPLSSLLFSLPQPMLKGKDAMLSFNDVLKMFGVFGTMLQHTLTEVPYSEINSLSNMEWDTVNTIPEFLKLWPQYDHKTLTDCAAGSSITISTQLQKEMIDRYYNFSAIDLRPELYKSALDLALHSLTDFWQDIVDEAWEIYMSPFPLLKMDVHLCCDTELICHKPAAYYCELWSKMLASELFALFQENLDNEKKLGQLGLQMRETILSESGAHPMSEMFKTFTERNPSVEPYLKLSKSCIVYDAQA